MWKRKTCCNTECDEYSICFLCIHCYQCGEIVERSRKRRTKDEIENARQENDRSKHRVVHDILTLVTGFAGSPMEVIDGNKTATISGMNIRKILGYAPPKVGARGGLINRGKDGHVGADVLAKLQLIYRDVRRYMPDYHIKPFDGEVKMKRMIHLLDTILTSAYGYSFCQIGKTDSYEMRPCKLFGQDTAVQMPV
jgi:hypothetical protein